MRRLAIFLFLLLSLFCAAGDLRAQNVKASPAEPLFKERPFGPLPPPTAPPGRKDPEAEPLDIPVGWWIAMGVTGALAIAALYYFSARRWHSSNLFDRQYRFKIVPDPALRFGAKKCGGHMARIDLGPLVRLAESEAKDA